MNNFRNQGNIVTLTAPAGGVTSGSVYLIGGFLVVAAVTAAAGASFAGAITGVVTLAKNNGETWTEGQPVYWDFTNSWGTTSPTAGLPIGAVATTGGVGSTVLTADVRLNGVALTGRVFNVRQHLAIATVNAGATLIPAVPGAKLRMIHASAIAVGGAAGAVTTVDVKGTQSTSVVKLVAFAQASLTQSAVLKDGGTGAAVLADGASYAPNDTNTAITCGVTGSAITTATFIDFNVDFALE